MDGDWLTEIKAAIVEEEALHYSQMVILPLATARTAMAEIEWLRARLTITDEKVEMAAKAGYMAWGGDDWNELTESWQTDWRVVARVALLAAGMEDDDAQPTR